MIQTCKQIDSTQRPDNVPENTGNKLIQYVEKSTKREDFRVTSYNKVTFVNISELELA